MEITYHGHSCFKLKGAVGTVVTDPYQDAVGFSLPNLSADVITVSHDHPDHNAITKIRPSARRERSFVIESNGEYEVGGISVFGTQTYHDASGGSERGVNTVFTIVIDEIRVCHLGDLGHELTTEQLAEIGAVDVVLCPVGGVYTINAELAVKTIHALEPGIAIPMHYKNPDHNPSVYGDLTDLPVFLKAFGAEVKPSDKLKLEKSKLPEETELVVLQRT